MKVTLVTQYHSEEGNDYQQLADITIANREEYCKRQNYKHIIQKGTYGTDPKMYYAYQRLKLCRDLMDKPDATELFWLLNISSVITNMEVPLHRVLLSEHIPYDFWVTKDVHGINGASLVFRNTKFSRDFIDFLLSLEPNYRDDPWHEQRAIMHNWLDEKWTYKISLLPQSAINSYFYQLYPPWTIDIPGQWRYGDLVVSFPGTEFKQRLSLVKQVTETEGVIYRAPAVPMVEEKKIIV